MKPGESKCCMEGSLEIKDPRTSWLAVVGICLVITCMYWFVDSRSTLWDRDEPRLSRATAEMIESGNYLYPTFKGQLRPDKPILIYWLMFLGMRVLGPTRLRAGSSARRALGLPASSHFF